MLPALPPRLPDPRGRDTLPPMPTRLPDPPVRDMLTSEGPDGWCSGVPTMFGEGWYEDHEGFNITWSRKKSAGNIEILATGVDMTGPNAQLVANTTEGDSTATDSPESEDQMTAAKQGIVMSLG